MRNDSSPNTPFTTVASIGTLLLALFCLAFLAWFIPTDRVEYFRLFAALKTPLMPATKFVVVLPDFAFPIAATVVGLLTMTVQWLSRSKSNAAVFHLLVVIVCCVAFVAYREAMVEPITNMFWDIARSRGRGS